MSGEEKSPTLTVECAHKGKKTGHVLSFTAGSALNEGTDMDAKGAQLILNMTVGGTKQKTDGFHTEIPSPTPISPSLTLTG